jgi:cytochrome b subunit of formate dehydrogenase
MTRSMTIDRSDDKRSGMTARLLPFAIVILAVISARTAESQYDDNAALSNRACLDCHGQKHLAELPPDERRMMVAQPPQGTTVSDAEAPPLRPGIYLGNRPLAYSSHAELQCIDCHQDISGLPHARTLGPVNCGACHIAAADLFERSAHGAALEAGEADAPTCWSCHGSHEILPSDQRHSMTFPFNAVRTCAECHEHHAEPLDNGENPETYITAYRNSVHGRGITEAGLLAAATCADCHGYHAVFPTDDPAAKTSRENIPDTCGSCHLGVVETYEKSIHGKRLAEGDDRAPVCVDCHAEHGITIASIPNARMDIVAECGECHDRPDMTGDRRASFYETYRASYHGQVNQLGSSRAARCSDCHGAHDILPIASEQSRVHPDNLVQTCGECHERANANFVEFDPHADYRDRRNYPLLYGVWWYFIIVMTSAFGFFGLHSILWFLRSLRERHRTGPTPRSKANPHGIRRFTAVNRFNHALVIISFFGLTLTGMPLLFSDQLWAGRLANVFGGVLGCGIWHRFFAIMLMFNFAVHFYSIYRSFRERRASTGAWLYGPRSMLPRGRDFRDFGAMARWFIRGGKRPTFDRWTYWEKFDYWAEIVGTVIIGGSGLLLWFPQFFSLFLPGSAFNVATIVHGYEALLAVGFIFTIHFFNAHLRPEKFPVDDVIFTGQMSEEEFRHEREAEYERVLSTGHLESLKVEPAPAWQHRLAIVVGVTAMAIGTTLVVLIILAGLEAL